MAFGRMVLSCWLMNTTKSRANDDDNDEVIEIEKPDWKEKKTKRIGSRKQLSKSTTFDKDARKIISGSKAWRVISKYSEDCEYEPKEVIQKDTEKKKWAYLHWLILWKVIS